MAKGRDPARPRDPAGVRLEPAEAAVVAELFSNYLQEGTSLKGQTQRLTSLAVLSPAGKTRWNQATVRGYSPILSTQEPFTLGAVVRQRRVDGTPLWFPLVEVEEDIPKRASKSGPP